ncbi:hypothetical protein [uncultured Dokdonia sp.]|uniref:hypothetical protein n=1 Tax=uncultured Dokdonia sp. TaxID=575653 RepID=UPI0026248FF9|nr:hypothetical protein [uncultured Dokdonia sp.]
MAEKNKSDFTVYIIGIAIIGFISFKIIGYILPDQEPNYTGTSLLEAVMDRNGGKEAWNAIEKMSYKKNFKLYNEDGSTEIDRKETHMYDFSQGTAREINWSENDTSYSLRKTATAIYQLKNGIVDTTVTATQLQSKLDAATFVVGLPYTLDDSSATLTYEGITEFQKKSCHVLKITFEGSKDIWRHYYEEKTLSWIGYWVHTSDHYSLIINEEMIEVDGFTLSRKRKSYRTDASQNPTYLRATYEYKAYQIEK